MPKILVIDDDKAVRISLSLLLQQNNYEILLAADPEEAIKITQKQMPDLFIMDMNFSLETSGEEGLKLLQQIKTLTPSTPVILITAWASISIAVEGMKLGAFDFISKPWDNNNLLQTVSTALQISKNNNSASKESTTRKKLDSSFDFQKLIGEDASFLEILETIGRVSETDASVLIYGESGTGKELIAEAIHNNSLRKDNPFVKVNLGAIPPGLFESEMFGHKKGSFTDAKSDRIGRFTLAHTGTIFLDEIGDINLNSQVKLLRVLQDRSFEVLGSSITQSVDIRLVSATNRNLEKMIADNEFREDLYYRINLITVKLPSLKERVDDIPLLVEHFLQNLKTIYQRENLGITPKAVAWLKNLSWKGNIRELKNLVERTVLVSTHDVLDTQDFQSQYQMIPRTSQTNTLPPVGALTLDEMEKSMIERALAYHNNNLTRVAQSLGLSRAALYRRIEKYGIEI